MQPRPTAPRVNGILSQSARSSRGENRSAKPRILMFAHAFFPDSNAESLVNSKLAMALLQNGADIDIISYNYLYTPERRYVNEWSDIWKPLERRIHPIDYHPNKSWRDILDNILQCLASRTVLQGNKTWQQDLALGRKLHSHRQYDLILARALPVAAILPALHLSKECKVPLIINLNDPPSGTWPGPYPPNPRWISFFEQAFLKFAFRNASAVTFPSPRLRRHVLRHLGIRPSTKYAVIPHIALHDSGNRKPSIDRSTFTLCHAGTVSGQRNPENFLKALSLLKESVPAHTLRCMFVGSMAPEHEALLCALELEDVVDIVGPCSYEDANALLRTASVQFIIEAPCEEGIFLPSKLVDYLQNSRPILAVSPKSGTLSDIVCHYGCGEAADCRDPQSIYSALNKMYSAWQTGCLSEQYSAASALHDFSSGVMKTYHELFDSVLNARASRHLMCPWMPSG